MGVDFSIDDEPRYLLSGTITWWTGRVESFEGREVSEDELRGMFEDPPVVADLHVRTQVREPALPDEVKALRTGMSYSAFGRLRKHLAATVGIDVEMMWGYMPEALRIAEIRTGSRANLGELRDYEAWAREQQDWWRQNARHWDTVDSGLVPLLDHSDAEGDLSPDECRRLAPAFAEALSKVGTDELDERYMERARMLLRMVEACAKYDRRLRFG